jgi:regulator of protease activity HflC (stomatin/prohibitin superfamily)
MLGFKFLTTRPTDHVVLYKSGRKAREGAGLGGIVFMPTATAAAVPMDARDDIFAVETMTVDYQTVVIQGLITFRIADANAAVQRQDFSIDLRNGRHLGEPMKQIVERLRAIVQSACRDALGRSSLDAALNKSDELSVAAMRSIAADAGLKADGIAVDRVLVMSVKPAPEIKKALEAKLRETLLREADTALFERRRAATADEHALKLREEADRQELATNEISNNLTLEAERAKLAEARAETALTEARSAAETNRERLKPFAEIGAAAVAAQALYELGIRGIVPANLSLGGDVAQQIAEAVARKS